MKQKYKKKLIEVAMPLKAINKASVRENSIRHGHPSTLHLYWARRPLAACRAVIFAQLVNDPSSHPEKFPSLEDQKKERERLFSIMEELVIWENSNNEEVLKKAHKEILNSCDGKLPPIYDPFSGGGSIPFEAQRLGLPAYGSDLNPVAVMIGKAMIEIPPLFKDMKPIHPGAKEKLSYRFAEGLAEDINYYGQWVRDKAFNRIGHLYPQADLPKELGGGKATVIALIWARTVPSPDPALGGLHVPLIRSYNLSTKKGKEAWVEPIIRGKEYVFETRSRDQGHTRPILKNTIDRQGGVCLISGSAMPYSYIRKQAQAGNMNTKLMAIVVEAKGGRKYISPYSEYERLVLDVSKPEINDIDLSGKTRVSMPLYGINTFGELFTNRQLTSLSTFNNLLVDLRKEIEKDALVAKLNTSDCGIRNNSVSAKSYSEAITVYISFAISRLANRSSTICIWNEIGEKIEQTFARQAIPMTWNFAESNPFSNSSGNWMGGGISWIVKCLLNFRSIHNNRNSLTYQDAQSAKIPENAVISTDPPYYDNIAYSDLSDFFYMWLKSSLKSIYPDFFNLITTPKAEELVATPYRHESKQKAEEFFLNGMTEAIKNMALKSSDDAPAAIYYAFQQSEIEKEGISSTGWATFLEAVIQAGYSIVGTWPMRLERATGLKAKINALATAIVLVCRKREKALGTITRAEFVRQLKVELPIAIINLKAANISPADIPQSSIGPGIGIFSRYQAVLENDDSYMSVKTALQLINRELGEEESEYDSETSFAITWFEQNGFNVGDFGSANNIANAKGISVNTLVHSGVAQSSGGKFSLLNRESLEDGWDPKTDKNLTIWECCQYLIKTLENEGEFEAAKLIKKMGSSNADSAKELAYTLYDIAANKRKDANEATAYNGLIAVWSELTAQVANITDEDLRGDAQMRMI